MITRYAFAWPISTGVQQLVPFRCRAPPGRPLVGESRCSSLGRTCCTRLWRPPLSPRTLRHPGALLVPPCSSDTAPRWARRPSGWRSCSALEPAASLESGLYSSGGTGRRVQSTVIEHDGTNRHMFTYCFRLHHKCVNVNRHHGS